MKHGAMLVQVLRSLFKKPATVCYPFEKLTMPEKMRGKLKFYPALCIGCKMCERDCPSGAIMITKIADKQFDCEVRLDKCIYCGQCAESCPKKALEMTPDLELASGDPLKLKVVYHGNPPEISQAKPQSSERAEGKA